MSPAAVITIEIDRVSNLVPTSNNNQSGIAPGFICAITLYHTQLPPILVATVPDTKNYF